MHGPLPGRAPLSVSQSRAPPRAKYDACWDLFSQTGQVGNIKDRWQYSEPKLEETV